MSKRTYFPDRGDLIEMSFQPAAGREIDKRSPAIVISPVAYNRSTGLRFAVPISSDMTTGPFWIPMPGGHLDKPSMILCDYLKSFDYRERGATRIGSVPAELVNEIVGRVTDIIDPIG